MSFNKISYNNASSESIASDIEVLSLEDDEEIDLELVEEPANTNDGTFETDNTKSSDNNEQNVADGVLSTSKIIHPVFIPDKSKTTSLKDSVYSVSGKSEGLMDLSRDSNRNSPASQEGQYELLSIQPSRNECCPCTSTLLSFQREHQDQVAKIIERLDKVEKRIDEFIENRIDERFDVLMAKLSNSMMNSSLSSSYVGSKIPATIVTNKNRMFGIATLEIPNPGRLTEKVKGAAAHVKGLNWWIRAGPDEIEGKKWLYFMLHCSPPREMRSFIKSWSCKAAIKYVLIAQYKQDFKGTNVENFVRGPTNNRYEGDSINRVYPSWGYPKFIEWDSILDESKGYTKGSVVKLEVYFSVDDNPTIDHVK